MRSTPIVVIVFLLVLQRWIEARSGWPDWAVFPVMALTGTVLLDRLVLPPASRLSRVGWLSNLAIAFLLGALLAVLSRR